MKKIFNIAALFMAGAMILGIASCARETLSTDQFSENEVVLSSYGPNPVARGGALRFIGSNLDQVASVTIPGLEPITDIEVVQGGSHGEIRIQLPKDGAEPGYITLTTRDKKTIKSKTELTYSEPIIFESFTQPSPSAMPGDEITIKGDYMNLIKEVIFSNNVVVGESSQQIQHVSRYELKVVVPSDAITGKIIIGDVDESVSTETGNLIYSDKELIVGDPTVTKAEKATYKAGAEITVKGAYLDMIDHIVIGDVRAEVSEIALDYKSLIFELPAEAADGMIEAVSYAGKKFDAGEIETVVPTDLAAAPSPVKAGKTLTVTGKDLDLVKSVDFVDAAAAEFTYAESSITVTVPAAAKEGDLTLNLANGKSVATAITLVKPVISSVEPTEVVAGQGEITVSGSDLDLATKVTLGGKEEAFAAAQDGSSLKISTSATSVSGKIVITTANGTEVTADQEITVTYDSYIVISSIPSAAHIGTQVKMEGSNFNMIESMYIGDAKVTGFISRTDNEYIFIMPYNKIGTYSIKFELFSGESETAPTPIEVLCEQDIKTLWSGTHVIGDWAVGHQALAYGAFDWSTLKAGGVLTFEVEQDAAAQWWQLALRHGNEWKDLPEPIFVEMTAGQTVVQVTLSQTNLDDLIANNGLIVFGCNYTLKSITYTTDISQEKEIWTGSFECTSSWSDGNQDLAWGGYDWSTVAPGTLMTLYLTPTVATGEWWCVKICHGQKWGALPNPPISGQYDSPGDKLTVELTQTVLDDIIANGGLVITGYCYVLSKVTLM